jgi:glycosyltransferase involved in cell wall biosynthesis
VPEAVEDGVTGLLVPPRDPEALAGAIIALLQDRERAEAMGQAGRARVERYFGVERMVQQTEALYEELIGEKMGLEWVEGKGWQPT